MTSIFREMYELWKGAEGRGIPPDQVTFCMNKRGMQRYMDASARISGAARRLIGVKIVYDETQPEDVTLHTLSN